MQGTATFGRGFLTNGNPATDRYTGVAIVLHWLVAALVIGQLFFGWSIAEIPRGSEGRGALVNLHKSVGLTIWLLVWIRLGWRWTHRPPPLPPSLNGWQRAAASASHFL